MAYVTVQLPTLVAAATSANSPTNAIGSLDDAESLTIFMVSTAAATSTGGLLLLQVSQFDPSLASSAAMVGVTVSTAYHQLSSLIFSTGAGLVTSSGVAITINNISYKGLRMIGLSSATSGEKIAFVSKQVLL